MSFTRGQRQGGFPKPGEELKDVPGRFTRDGWTHVADHDSTYIEGKQYKHMREWTRPCAICGGPMQAFEKLNTADANSRFGNRTCKEHRGLLPAFEKGFIAWDKSKAAMVPGYACTSAIGTAAAPEQLQMINNTMKQELDGLYGRVNELFAENQVLKAKLATYELSEATFEQALVELKTTPGIRCEPVQNDTINGSLTLPWFKT